MANAEHVTIFGRQIRRVGEREFVQLASAIANDSPQLVFFCNVHMLMLSLEDDELATGMSRSDWVFADSAPVAWIQRRISGLDAKVIPGYEMLLAICSRAAQQGERVGFMGSTPQVMEQLVSRLQQRFPTLEIAFHYSPPYAEGDLGSSAAELRAIASSNLNWLFVGLGCPKQEKWSARYAHGLKCHVLAVGAAFDWLAGTTPKPPGWMERYGLAWAYRLTQNPKKMWQRYLIYNSKFVLKSVKTLGWDRLFSTSRMRR